MASQRYLVSTLARALHPSDVFGAALGPMALAPHSWTNLSSHKSAKAAECLRAAGCWFLFLPAYSPDLNPIEMPFSKLKAHLRRIGARTIEDMGAAIASILNLFSPEGCSNYLEAAGYRLD